MTKGGPVRRARAGLGASILACVAMVGPAPAFAAWQLPLRGTVADTSEGCDAWDKQMQDLQDAIVRRHEACLDTQACKTSRNGYRGACSCAACEDLHEQMDSFSRGEIAAFRKQEMASCRARVSSREQREADAERRNREAQEEWQRRNQALQEQQRRQQDALRQRNQQLYDNAVAAQQANQQRIASVNRSMEHLRQSLASPSRAGESDTAVPLDAPPRARDEEPATTRYQGTRDRGEEAPAGPRDPRGRKDLDDLAGGPDDSTIQRTPSSDASGTYTASPERSGGDDSSPKYFGWSHAFVSVPVTCGGDAGKKLRILFVSQVFGMCAEERGSDYASLEASIWAGDEFGVRQMARASCGGDFELGTPTVEWWWQRPQAEAERLRQNALADGSYDRRESYFSNGASIYYSKCR